MGNLNYISKIYDFQELPYPKTAILQAIVSVYKISTDVKFKEPLKVGLLTLAQFQESVGKTPVTILDGEYMFDERYPTLQAVADEEHQLYLKLLD